MVPIRSYLFCRFIRTCKVGFCREAPKPLTSWGNVTGERGEPPCTSPVSRKYERVGTKVRTNRDLRGGMPTCFFRRGAPGPGIFDRRAAEQGRAAGVRMNWGRSTNESVHSRPPGPDLPGTKRPTAPSVRTNRYGGSISLPGLHDLFVAWAFGCRLFIVVWYQVVWHRYARLPFPLLLFDLPLPPLRPHNDFLRRS